MNRVTQKKASFLLTKISAIYIICLSKSVTIITLVKNSICLIKTKLMVRTKRVKFI